MTPDLTSHDLPFGAKERTVRAACGYSSTAVQTRDPQPAGAMSDDGAIGTYADGSSWESQLTYSDWASLKAQALNFQGVRADSGLSNGLHRAEEGGRVRIRNRNRNCKLHIQ